VIFSQLPLSFKLKDDATFANFYPGKNVAALSCLWSVSKGQGEQFVYLSGFSGVGKTHLLQAVCHATLSYGVSSLYLPLKESTLIETEYLLGLENLENLDVICLDDLDKVAGCFKEEEALFHLYNRIRENGGTLLVASKIYPIQSEFQLPDLTSRLGCGVMNRIFSLNDEEKLAALQLRAQVRGLSLDETVGGFLLRRCPRDMLKLFSALEKLDKAALANQRRLTIPFVKIILGF